MVNAQEYIENNFPKHVSEIIAIEKNLEGDLDLSEYPNLHKVDIGYNSQLRSLRLAYSNRIAGISIFSTGINDFSFLADMPDIHTICLSQNFGVKIGEGTGQAYIAKAIRESNRAKLNQLNGKDQRIKELQSQLDQEQANNQNLKQQNSQLTSQLQQKKQELENLSKENQQFRKLSDLLSPNQPYNFTELKAEITRLIIQELAPQIRSKRTELDQLITNAKTRCGDSSERMVDLLLETQQQIEQTNDAPQKLKLSGKIEAYQSILEVSLTQEETTALLNRQTELLQLENQLTDLQATN